MFSLMKQHRSGLSLLAHFHQVGIDWRVGQQPASSRRQR